MRSRSGLLQFAVGIAPRQSLNFGPGLVLCHFDAGVVEFIAADEIDHRSRVHGFGGKYCDVSSDETDLSMGVLGLDGLRARHVVLERRRAGVKNKELVIVGDGEDVRHGLVMGRGVHQLASGHHGGRLSQPGRKPVRRDLAFRLITGAGSTVKSIERRRAKKERLLH